jgi:uncharacterized protein (TIGR01777 family)
MQILVTGGTGFIGRALVAELLARRHSITVLTRSITAAARLLPATVKLTESLDRLNGVDAVINLAGENLGEGRWTAARKRMFRESRIGTTQKLLDWMARVAVKPSALISGSAIGYYGLLGADAVTESDSAAADFVGQLCADWERKAVEAETLGVRVCRVRIGIVLGPKGGALAKMLPPFKLGLGGPMGSGRQWMSWIHLDDLVALIYELLMRKDAQGAFNATAPNPATNAEFSQALGAALNRPARLPMPALLLRTMLGEMADLLLTGRRVLPAHAEEIGFEFQYPTLESCLQNIIRRRLKSA